MLPLNCLRCADSKSNSSTRLPRKTTTRVSSGWVASMSILLAIGKSHGDRARSRRAASAGGEETGPIFVKRSGPEVASTASVERPAAGKRQTGTAELFNVSLDLRFEHKLQTAMRRQRGTRPRFRSMPAMRRDAIERLCRCACAARAVRVVLIPTGLGKALRRCKCRVRRRHDRSEHLPHERRGTAADRKQRLPGSRIVLREPIAAHAPGGRHADATGTFHRQHALLKAAAAELASRLWDLPSGETGFALLPGLFTG